MRLIDFIFAGLFVFGGFSLFYLTTTFFHEYMHYINAKNQGIEINEFVILGWKKNTTSGEWNDYLAWVMPERFDYNHTFDEKWDCSFIRCWGEYNGG